MRVRKLWGMEWGEGEGEKVVGNGVGRGWVRWGGMG